MNGITQEEHVDAGADVIGSDGEKIGTVTYVVARPPALDITDIVVGTGALLGRDIVVPTDQVDRIEDGRVYLRLDRSGLERLPDYVDVKYETPPTGWIPPDGFYYPSAAVLWPAGAYYPQPSSVTVNAPAGTVGMHEGMEVESSDGHTIGSIAGFDIEGETVAAFVVKEGFIFHHDVRIPVGAVAGVEEGKVRLNLTKDEASTRFQQPHV
jgi:uncharacterized protein YrrD